MNTLSWWASIPGVTLGVKRSAQEEMALRVRMLQGRHIGDVLDRCRDELADRAKEIGPADLSCNLLARYATRRALAYLTPPLVTGLGYELFNLIGDANAETLKARYTKGGGLPMPSMLPRVGDDGGVAAALKYRIGCNYVGVALGWAPRPERPYARVVTPDCLEVEYNPDDPFSPSVIRHYMSRQLANGQWQVFADEYDLTDLDRPSYRVLTTGGEDRTADFYPGAGAWPDWLRYKDGRPFHRIVVSGDPRQPHIGVELAEGTLRAAVGRTIWWAGFRDSSHPERNVRGMRLAGADSSADTGETGIPTGPEYIRVWVDDDPERPGTYWQWSPAFDPETTWRALTAYEADQLSAMGLPVRFEATGGEPTETERRQLQEFVGATYPACRGQDVLILRRMAAIANRKTGSTLPEGGYGVLYREEVEEALGAVETPEPAPGDEPDTNTEKE